MKKQLILGALLSAVLVAFNLQAQDLTIPVNTCALEYPTLEALPADSEPAFIDFMIETSELGDFVLPDPYDFSIYRGDFNNDGVEEWIYASNGGSSKVLHVEAYIKTEETWREIDFPLDTWVGRNDELFGLFCGDTVISLDNGYIWKANVIEPYCQVDWVTSAINSANERIADNQFVWAEQRLNSLPQECGGYLTGEQLVEISKAKNALASAQNSIAIRDFKWVKDSLKNEVDFNSIRRDDRFDSMVTAITNSTVFRDYLLTNLSGSSPVVRCSDGTCIVQKIKFQADRYLSMTACRPRSCGDNGFLWVDLKSNEGIAAIVRGDGGNYIAVVDSSYFDAENYPDEFLRSLRQTYFTDNIRVITHDENISLYADEYWDRGNQTKRGEKKPRGYTRTRH